MFTIIRKYDDSVIVFDSVDGSKEIISHSVINKLDDIIQVLSIEEQKIFNKMMGIDTVIFDVDDDYDTARKKIQTETSKNPLIVYNFSDISDMRLLFSGCDSLSIDLRNFNTSKVCNMFSMFSHCNSRKLYLDGFDTSNVVSMEGMFMACKAEVLDLRSFNTSNVVNMDYMFSECKASEMNLSSFDTSNVITMVGMFANCSSLLKELDLSGFNTSKVKDMSNMFYFSTIKHINLEGFDTSKVNNMKSMFRQCCIGDSLLDLSCFDTSYVESMDSMFYACTVDEINIGNFNIRRVSNMLDMFFSCNARILCSEWFKDYIDDKLVCLRKENAVFSE